MLKIINYVEIIVLFTFIQFLIYYVIIIKRKIEWLY